MFLHENYFFSYMLIHEAYMKEVEETEHCLLGKGKDGSEFDDWAYEVTRCCSDFSRPSDGVCAEVKLYDTS